MVSNTSSLEIGAKPGESDGPDANLPQVVF